jgi:Predicted enzyme related to lactoylglutathione lyase
MDTSRNPVGWFEIPTKDILRAKKFYEDILDSELELKEMNIKEQGAIKMAVFPMTSHAQGAAGSLVEGKEYSPSHKGSRIYFSVENIEETLDRVEKCGGKVIQPKTSIGQYGYIAHVEDTEGNEISLHVAH